MKPPFTEFTATDMRRILEENVMGRISDAACAVMQAGRPRPTVMILSRDLLDKFLNQKQLYWIMPNEPVVRMEIMGYDTWIVQGPVDLLAFNIAEREKGKI